MNSKKIEPQTAVDWFYRWFNDNQEATHKEFNQAFQQAKQMEKDQMMDAYNSCRVSMMTAEQYYKETYEYLETNHKK
jgi:hypothetical protein